MEFAILEVTFLVSIQMTAKTVCVCDGVWLQVADLITSINVIINEFPLLHDSSDIIKKINNTLTLAKNSQ